MTQILAPSEKSLALGGDNRILCSYINVTTRIQIIRITNTPNLNLERVVFPGQRLMFEAVPAANLEVHTSEIVTLIIPCQRLRMTESLTAQ
jgi:hypothetical protein